MKLSKLAEQMKPSTTLAITSKAKELKKQGKDVVSLGAGELDFEVPEPIKQATIESINKPGIGKYTDAAGIPELIDAIREKFQNENNITYSPSQIIVCPGAKYSLYLVALTLLDSGDEAIIPSPFWLSYESQVKLCNAAPVFVKTNKFQLDIEEIRKKITKRTKLIYINSPNNPSGAVYSKEQLVELAQLAVENKIHVISDDIYEKIYYGKKPVSVASLENEVPGIKELTIVVNGPSKEFAIPGWRIGYAAGPEEIIKKMSAIQSHTTSNTSTVMQYATLAGLKFARGFIKDKLGELDRRRKYMVTQLNKMSGINCTMPEGAFYTFPNISGTGMKSEEFSKKLLEEAYVAVIPGIAFGDDDCVRLSYATSMDNIIKSMARMNEWLTKLSY